VGLSRAAKGEVKSTGMLGDDDRPLTAWRALRAPEFWLLLVGCIAAAAGVGAMVVVPLIVAGLSISSFPKYMTLWPCAKRAGVEGAWWRTVARSISTAWRQARHRCPVAVVVRSRGNGCRGALGY
jgi:hypothetical protein